MTNIEWPEKKALDALRAFGLTISFSADEQSIKPRAWRRVRANGLDIPAFYDAKALHAVADVLMEIKYVSSNYHCNTVERIVADQMIVHVAKKERALDETAREILNTLLRAKCEKMNVYMPVYGVSVPDGQHFSVGHYTFIAGDAFDMLGITDPPEFVTHVKEECLKGLPLVMVTEQACDPNKAREKAMEEFQWLENATRLFIDSNTEDFGIISYNFTRIENSVVTQPDGFVCEVKTHLKGSPHAIPFNNLFNLNSHPYKVVSALGDESKITTELQKRMRHAVYLGGLAVHATAAPVSFFLGITAMEALLQSQTDKYVSPSIAQQILENYCYLFVPKANRRSVFDKMRTFYRKRSAIAHGGKKEIRAEDAQLVRKYLRHAIIKLLTDPELSTIRTDQDMENRIKDLKFGTIST